ncbi:PriCT-2 domain-containing protein [Neisseria gonorrhoeae]|uniref:TraC n=1 Tax=Neisseria gonorrhoeae TaxID=485 RepID=A0AB74EIH7_NEIGO|nr:PriCT-2 domain-containing protein [Neisseria gonorrhoeae]SBQ22139.1 TraC [Neisseria gonorrhoeae]
MSDYNEIRNALNHLDANDRDFWVKMGAAVKDELGEDGFELWDEWSRHSENYKSNDAKAVWKSLKQGHIHIGTLFYHARENGYHPNKPYTPPSAEELAKRAAETQEKQRAEAERIAQAHAKAEKAAYGIWKNASPADPNHAYAQTKGLGLNTDVMSGIRQNEYQGKKQLIIPLYSKNKLVNVQTIDEDGHKKFLNGGQKQGAYTVIGDLKQSQNGIFLAEGFATASSVYQATKKPVVVAFDAGNLKAVSEKLINVLPENVPVYFAADNDPKPHRQTQSASCRRNMGRTCKNHLA